VDDRENPRADMQVPSPGDPRHLIGKRHRDYLGWPTIEATFRESEIDADIRPEFD
jgi:hypothetical protein